jgi:hypothetical protein
MKDDKAGKLPSLPKTTSELLKMGIPEVFKKTCSAGPFLR